MKEFKSILTSVFVILLYVYATEGIVKWLWATNNENVFKARVTITFIMMFIVSLFFIIFLHYIVSSPTLYVLYNIIIVFHIIYLVLGSILNTSITKY